MLGGLVLTDPLLFGLLPENGLYYKLREPEVVGYFARGHTVTMKRQGPMFSVDA